jgi:hypothetical protein
MQAKALPRRDSVPTPRLVFLPDAMNPEGEPRIGLLRPGDRHPSVFRSVAAALAAIDRAAIGGQEVLP